MVYSSGPKRHESSSPHSQRARPPLASNGSNRNALLIGLGSPLHSLRFLRRNKTLLLLGLAPQIMGLGLFVVLAAETIVPFLTATVAGWMPVDWQSAPLSFILSAVAVGLVVILYALVWIPLVSVLANPIYDFIARQAFAAVAGHPLPPQSLADTIKCVLSEALKLLGYFALLALALVVPPMAPAFLLFSVWYLGWDIMDRTLAQTPLSLRQRLGFGARNATACLGLGIWAYLPFAGVIFGFAFAAAGGIATARLGHTSFPDRQRPGADG